MNYKIAWAIFLLLSCTNYSFSQKQSLTISLTVHKDSLMNIFYFVNPNKQSLDAKLPNVEMESYTLSRYIDFTSCNVKLPVYMGIRSNGSRVIAFDKNLNYDFRDEELIEFADTIHTVLEGNFKTVRIKVNDSLTIAFDYTIIKPSSLHFNLGSSVNPIENHFFLAVRPHEYRTGIVRSNDSSEKFALITKMPYSFDKLSTYMVMLDKEPGDADFYDRLKRMPRLTVGNKVRFNQKPYIFKSISSDGKNIVLEPIPDENVTGNTAGFKAYDINTVSINNDSIKAINFKGSYVLLEFWGTWCGPCKMVLPRLKLLHQQYPRLKMVGIAFDKEVKQVKEFVKKENITWDQVFDENSPSNIGNSICELYQVNSFPSYIVIDPAGTIVYRGAGADGFDELMAFIGKLNM